MNLITILQKIVKKYKEKTAIIEADNNLILSYREFYEKIELLSCFFKKNGIDEGYKVGIYLKNSSLYIISFFALLYLGAIPVLIDEQFTEREIRECLNNSDTKILLSEEDDNKKKIFKNLSTEFNLFIYIEKNNDIIQNTTIFNFNIINKQNIDFIKPYNQISYVIMFTYRGYGYPIPVLLSEKAIINSIIKNDYLTKEDYKVNILLILPFTHILALTTNILNPLYIGGTIVITNKYIPTKILKIINEYKIRYIILVPTLVKLFLYYLKKNNLKLLYLKKGIVGGNSFSKELFNEWNDITNCILLQGYGLTETCPLTCNQFDDNKPDSIGKIMHNVQIKIGDKFGNELPVNKEGIIWAKSDAMMDGYLKFDFLNKEYFIDGWFNTGDIGYKDKDDFFYFIRREKKIAKIGGVTVDIFEIKNIIESHPDILNVEINIKEDPLWQEKLECIITTDKELTKIDIYDYCRQYLSSIKIPKDIKIIKALSL